MMSKAIAALPKIAFRRATMPGRWAVMPISATISSEDSVQNLPPSACSEP
jgi:hypothetical protein